METITGVSVILNDNAQLLFWLSMAIALVICFAGYKTFRVWVIIAAALGSYLGSMTIITRFVPKASGLKIAMIALIVAVVLCVVLLRTVKAAVFLYAGMQGAALARMIHLPDSNIIWQLAKGGLIVGLFVLAGYLALRIGKNVVILLTAIVGGTTIAYHLPKMLPMIDFNEEMMLGVCALLILAGVAVQTLVFKDSK